jgi:hypothetical protein
VKRKWRVASGEWRVRKRRKDWPQRRRDTEIGARNEFEKRERRDAETAEIRREERFHHRGHGEHGEEWETDENRTGQPEMAVLPGEHDDFAGFGVYGWERAACSGMAFLRR